MISAVMLLSGCVDSPNGNDTRRNVRQSANSWQPTRPEDRQCLTNLGSTQASFTPLPDRYFGAGCSTLNTVRLASLQGDSRPFDITNLGPVTCPTANIMAAWARFGVDRAARIYLGSPLVRIETMGSYNCRNVAGTSRRSGHATANAIDISAFILADGRRISVLHDWNGANDAERRFLRVVFQSACKRFGMVLGPDYNEAHRDHLHLEEKPGTYCR